MKVNSLLDLYDVSDPDDPNLIITGYDKDHARRTASIVDVIAPKIGIDDQWLESLHQTALLHDIGRVGLDPDLFSIIFRTAEEAGIPIRLPDMKMRFPHLRENEIVERFMELSIPSLVTKGIDITERVIEHVKMRMDYKGRVSSVLKNNTHKFLELGVVIESWMEKVILYYYYPEVMKNEPEIVRRMGMLLVACENFEALNNFKRGRDYYGRTEEKMNDVFSKLDEFVQNGLIDRYIVKTLAKTALAGDLNAILSEARGIKSSLPMSNDEQICLRAIAAST